MNSPLRLVLLALPLAALAVACAPDTMPSGLKRTPPGNGPTIRFDLYHTPLPEIPLPNDAAMWPDPTSRTGLRMNGTMIAPTEIDRVLRADFDQLEGWGTFAPITVSFNKVNKDDPRPAIDLENVIRRHQGDDYEFDNDAVYVVNLNTGVPVPLDLGEGSFQYILHDKNRYWLNDTRVTEENLLWDSADETVNPTTGKFEPARTVNHKRDGLPIYRPQWDTDFDGVLDRPNLDDPDACPNQGQVSGSNPDPAEVLKRDQCIADHLLTWYERETDTMIMRPLIPLREKTEYAVVITDRLVDPDGNPVRSPFNFVYYPSQQAGIEKLKSFLSDPKLASYYGDIGGTGLQHVAFAWTFTTQPVQEDLELIRNGLYGTGPFAYLAKKFPAHLVAARAPGLVDPEKIASGTPEPKDWQDDPRCKPVASNYRIVKVSTVKSLLGIVASTGFGISGPTATWLLNSFDAIDHFVAGTFQSPFFLSGGPQSTDPNASFHLDYRTGKGKVYSDTVQFLIAVPKETAQHHQPFPIAYYGHGYTSSDIEMLGFAGSLAEQGIASVGMNAVFHGLDLSPSDKQLAATVFGNACLAPFANALLYQTRARDLDGDGIPDSGGDYWTAYLFHTRDVVRQSVIDSLQMFRIFKSFDGKNMATQQSDPDPNKLTLAGDFDGNGVPDIGGPNNPYYVWGQSLGGILSPFMGALDPDVVAAAPGSGAGGLLDVGARTIQGGAYEGIYLRMLGPLIVGVPASSLDPESTMCSASQVSLRFDVISVNNEKQVEFGCFDPSTVNNGQGMPKGGTVLVTDGDNGKVRCARMDPTGVFRIGIPTSVGDRLEVQIWDHPDIVDTYDGDTGCHIDAHAGNRVALINTWGKGLIPNGATDSTGETTVCTTVDGCSQFQSNYYPAGSPLRSIVEGFGLIRQTPDLRRLMNLAANVIDPGDPVNFAPYFALRPMTDPWGNVQPPTGLLNIVTLGDNNVPINTGVELGRAAGAVPFLRPDAAERYPAYADYVTPAALYQALGGVTANRYLIDHHVLEGLSRLQREPPPDLNGCHANEVPLGAGDPACHPPCTGTDTSTCLSGQVCQNGHCVAPAVSPDTCAQYLFDVDALDQNLSGEGMVQAPVPLRLARVAMPATPSTINDVWAPRLEGVPYSPDKSAWQANQRVIAQVFAPIEPLGVHGFNNNDPCEAWQSGAYMINLIGRFFSTSGADVYYLSHPATHECLEKPIGAGGCSFVKMP
jgi:hypothetical protein